MAKVTFDLCNRTILISTIILKKQYGVLLWSKFMGGANLTLTDLVIICPTLFLEQDYNVSNQHFPGSRANAKLLFLRNP